MNPREIRPGIHLVGAVDWDRRLFDSLIPLPQGTSYNAFVVAGSEKVALLDTVEPKFWETLHAQLEALPPIDYIVHHHGEQDHSGSLPHVLDLYPKATVVTNEKCKAQLIDHLHVDPNRFLTIRDGETLSLGDRTLRFVFTPWVHWPETFCSYLEQDRILFSCDFFGSHLATTDLYAQAGLVDGGAKRYYAELMAPFAPQVAKDVAKVRALDIDLIAPSHGPLWDRPAAIMDAYSDWASAAARNLVAMPYVTMHESTRVMVDALTDALADRGVAVERFDLTTVDLGELAVALVDAATIIVATPTVVRGPHPLAAYAAILANSLRAKARWAGVIGSYGWGGKTVEALAALLPDLKVELLEPVLVKGLPRDEDLAALAALADTIAANHTGLAAPRPAATGRV